MLSIGGEGMELLGITAYQDTQTNIYSRAGLSLGSFSFPAGSQQTFLDSYFHAVLSNA